VPASAWLSLMFSRWRGCFVAHTISTSKRKYVFIYLNNDDLKPQVKIGTSSGHAVLNEIQWFILVAFKSDVPKNEVHELGDSQHTLSVYCGRYIRITSEYTHVYLSKKDWSKLMNLASGCIDREVIKHGRLQDELPEWRNKCWIQILLYPSRNKCHWFQYIVKWIKVKNWFFWWLLNGCKCGNKIL